MLSDLKSIKEKLATEQTNLEMVREQYLRGEAKHGKYKAQLIAVTKAETNWNRAAREFLESI